MKYQNLITVFPPQFQNGRKGELQKKIEFKFQDLPKENKRKQEFSSYIFEHDLLFFSLTKEIVED